MKGDGRVYQRGNIWWVAYYADGREYRETSRSRDRKDAERLRRQRVGEIATGALRGRNGHRLAGTRRLTMLDVFDLIERHYQVNIPNSRTHRWCLKRLRRRFAGYKAQACTSLAISEYMDDMLREGRKVPTINREISVLRTALRLAHHHELIDRVPSIKLIPDHSVRNEFFTRPELDALIPCLPEHLRDVVLFAYLTGWRQGEIMNLEWANVNRAEKVIRLEPAQNKNRTVRVLAIQGELSELIERRWRARKAGRTLARHVFHRNGKQLKDFWKVWVDACHKAGLGHRMFHSLRRTAARNMCLQGYPEKVIMSIMGHSTRSMFDRYNIVTEADQRGYIERLFGVQHGQ